MNPISMFTMKAWVFLSSFYCAIIYIVWRSVKVSTENYKFFQNNKCEYFPCHKTNEPESFNCLFCYCPLYMLKDECGGNYIITRGIKDCSKCLVPHSTGSYERIMAKMKEVIKRGSDF